MVEVDPKLFVTCRLCLEVEGQFQIVPDVQHQIKYCFDIEVESFDGLPQLICKKCENILSEYYSKKKIFIEKQKELKNNVQGNAKLLKSRKSEVSPLEQENLDNANNQDRPVSRIKNHKNKLKRRRIHRISSSSDNDSVTNNSFVPEAINKNNDGIAESEITKTRLNKYFVCRICKQKHPTKELVKHHLREHNTLFSKFRNVFNKSCLVVMERFDDKAHIMNSNNAVMYNPDTIILNEHTPYYYTVCNSNEKDFTQIHTNANKEKHSSESDSEIPIKPKRQRLLSRSSGDTIVIAENNNQSNECNDLFSSNKKIPPTVIDCIDIDDSSDNDEKEKGTNKNTSTEIVTKNTETLYRPIQTIVRLYYERYLQFETLERDTNKKKRTGKNRHTELLLQRKILSMGSKVITKKGFNCTGLLRFMEYKNLDVVWKQLTHLNAGKEGKYVRIYTKLKDSAINESKNSGWKNIDDIANEDDGPDETIKLLGQLRASNFNNVYTVEEANTIPQSTPNLPRIGAVFSHANKDLNKAAMDSDSQLKKLLNMAPVLNPKQLPRKGNNEVMPFNITKVYSAALTNLNSLDAKEKNENTEISRDNNMPIISSPRSLAHDITNSVLPNTIINDETVAHNTINSSGTLDTVSGKKAEPVHFNLNSEPQTSYPRIKVKPVSELMPQTNTDNVNTKQHFKQILNESPNVLTYNDNARNKDMSNSVQSSNTAWTVQNIPLNHQQKSTQANSTTQPSSNNDYVLLDTVEFPNTRTYSPFKYFKYLLLVHNIILLDSDKPLPRDAACLVSLQIGFQQEKCVPVNLHLALFCYKTTFCIKIKDSKQRDVNVNMFSAIWQWELLKVYNDNVVNKVLQTAQKISQDTYHYTKNFFSLLKSINLKKL